MMLETAETKFVEARGTKYAYRSIGKDSGNLPLVLMQHFTGTIDGWDPLVVNGLAKHRLVDRVRQCRCRKLRAARRRTTSPKWRSMRMTSFLPLDSRR